MAARTLRTHLLSALGAGSIMAVAFMGPAAHAGQAEDETPQGPPPEPEGGISQGDLDSSITVWSGHDNITDLGDSESEEEDVVVLETDLLFSAMEWELPDSASSAIAELTEEVPEGAVVDVHGHTDSNPVPEAHDFDNQELSERRAEAVADVLEEERPDLELNVEGFGDEEPAVTEDEDDPSTLAANRRVEIRYGD